ncbi:hypothetical protein DFH09DRAFT_1078035 [Mycena vulgaris]|nr:hypothetical protein DFH09DRAFT_1078035 [Mycena vulgaris]
MLDALKAAEPTWILGPVRLKKLLKLIADEEAKEEAEREESEPYINLTIWPLPGVARPDRMAGHTTELLDMTATTMLSHQIATWASSSICDSSNSRAFLLTCIQIMQKRAVEEPGQRAHALYTMWLHFEPAAKKAGVPLENLRAQLTEEYGLDPLTAAPPQPRNDMERAALNAQLTRKKAEHRRTKMSMMRKMREMGAPIPLDPVTGDVAWDDEKHGEFVVLVTRVDKATGLEEFASW